MFGKEIVKFSAKKNKLESKVAGIVDVLQEKSLSTKAFEIDNGKTDEGWEFFSWRFYFKKKRDMEGEG